MISFICKYRDLYAFQNKEKYSARSEKQGWPLYRIEEEFNRQKLDQRKWRITKFNQLLTHPELPNEFIVPASFPEGMRTSLTFLKTIYYLSK